MTSIINKETIPLDFTRRWLSFLDYNSGSLLLSQTNPKSNIVVGVPHHGPYRFSRMLCDRNADENAGYLGAYLFEKLDCSLIIANRYFCDPNKDETTDYCKFIAKTDPDMLVEVHGHGGTKAVYDIEISSGEFDKEYSKKFAKKLAKKMKHHPELKKYTISGDYDKIYYTAQFSLTVTDKRWHTLHIELPRTLRKTNDSIYPPAKGFQLMDLIVETLKEQMN
jgi:hypothetical protein